MAEPLKNYYRENVIPILGKHIQKVYAEFNFDAFCIAATNGFSELELLDRGRHLATQLHPFLPQDFAESASILVKAMDFPLNHTDYEPMKSFFYMPHLNFIAQFGLDFPLISLPILKEMTKKFSAEFAIRPFIKEHRELVFTYLNEWKNDSNVHVRRLVSEGTRPLLPWSFPLRELQQHPKFVLPLLKDLALDSEEYVRRSVANHLNDISKMFPDVTITICEQLLSEQSQSETIKKLTKHALRTLIKKQHPSALALLGLAQSHQFEWFGESVTPSVLSKGYSVQLNVTIKNNSATSEKVLLDFCVHFVKQNGSSQPKVFKWFLGELSANEQRVYSKKITIQDFTTRKIYPGMHKVEAQLNGTTFELGTFEVL